MDAKPKQMYIGTGYLHGIKVSPTYCFLVVREKTVIVMWRDWTTVRLGSKLRSPLRAERQTCASRSNILRRI